MAQSETKTVPKLSFQSSLLARLNASTRAAQQAKRKAELDALETRRREQEAADAAEKERIRKQVDKLVERNAHLPRMLKKSAGARRRSSADPDRPRAAARTRSTAAAASRSTPPRRGSPVRKRRPDGPPKPLPGMEFVVRKTVKKSIKVPHTSDYSDMFGDDYLVGAELAVTKKMARESAAAAKENEKIRREKQQQREKNARDARDAARKEEDLRRRGLLTEKNKRKLQCEASAKDWVAVDVPVPVVGTARKDVPTRPVSSTPEKVAFRPDKESRSDREVAAKIRERDVRDRKKALKERILAMSGGASAGAAASPARRKRSREREESDIESESDRELRRMSRASKRRALEDKRERPSSRRDDEHRRRVHGDDEYRRRAHGGRHARVDMGYNSEEWSDAEDDDDDDSDDGGIEALFAEEERSARLGALEDKKERMREMKHKREKERRRREHESRYG